MAEIVRILIKGMSGFCFIDDAYSDKITITPNSITYEYKPYEESQANKPKKWSYKTSSQVFYELFEMAADKVSDILAQEDELIAADDIGCTTIVVTYADKTRMQREYSILSDDFEECFALIKQMVPGLEAVPAVLTAFEDECLE